MPPKPSTELTPLIIPHDGPVRACYTHDTNFCATESGYGMAIATQGALLKRAQSHPVLTDHALRLMPLSPLFYRKYYMAKGGTMVTSGFNLASATLGAGALALPHAMLHSGLIGGIVFLALVCALTIYSVFLLVRVGEITGLKSYEELSAHLVGLWSERVTAFFVIAFCWGVAVMYVVVMGDFVVPLVEALDLPYRLGRRSAMLVFWACVMLPLSLVRNVHTLRYASIVGTASTLLLAVALVLKALTRHNYLYEIPLFRLDADSIGAFSTFVFSYCCQPVVFRLYAEMQKATVGRMALCASCSMVACTTVYIATGAFGVVAYGPNTHPNILTNFANRLDLPYVRLAYLGMAVAVTMAFPMAIFPTRDSIVMALGYHEESNPVSPWLSSTIAGLLAFFALLLGIFVPNIRVLFDVLGGVCGGSLSFMLPGLFALRCGHWQREQVGLLHVLGAWVTTLAGVAMCVVGTYNSIRSNFA